MTQLMPSGDTIRTQIELAKTLASAQLLPRQYQGNPANLLWAIQYAESLGVHPMTAVTGIHVIEGKPTASAQLIGGLVRRAGHKLRVTFDRQAMRATAQIIRADDPGHTFESVWDLERAKAANLTGKAVWKSYPDAMLKARAITEVARDAAPEALHGVIYTAEELGAEVEVADDGEMIVIDATEPRDLLADDPTTTDVATAKKTLVSVLAATGLTQDAAIAAARELWAAEVEPRVVNGRVANAVLAAVTEAAEQTPVAVGVTPDAVTFDGSEAIEDAEEVVA
jgi:hypothetical protein